MRTTDTISDEDQPTILVSGQITDNTEVGRLIGTPSVQSMVLSLRRQGIKAIEVDHRKYFDDTVGAFRADLMRADLAAADGIVFMGNDQDIDPSEYGEQADPNTKSETNPDSYRAVAGKWSSEEEQVNYEMGMRRSIFENAAMKEALDTSMPVLGICAGMQRINITGMHKRNGDGRNGGNLHQHIEGMWQEQDMSTPVKYIQIQDNTRLSDMATNIPSERADREGSWIKVNSRQHQVIKDIAKDFKPTAYCVDDGAQGNTKTIQGIEFDNPHQFVMGVQWHPEMMPEHALSQKIFAGIANAARDRMEAKAAGTGTISFTARMAQQPAEERIAGVA